MSNNWRDVTLGQLETELAFIVQENDPVAANNLINYFHERFSDVGLEGCPKGDVGILCEYMQHVFKKIVVENYRPEQALGLKRRKGKYPRAIEFERDYEIAAYLELLTRQGMLWEKAVGEAANRYFDKDRGDRSVIAAYQKHKEIFKARHLSDEDLKAISDGELRS